MVVKRVARIAPALLLEGGPRLLRKPFQPLQGKSHAPMLPRDTADLRDLLVEAPMRAAKAEQFPSSSVSGKAEHYGLPELRKRSADGCRKLS